MEQLQRWRSMARAMCGSPCHRSAWDEPALGKRRSGKRQNPDAINALRRDIAISTAMGLDRVVRRDRVERNRVARNRAAPNRVTPSCGGLIDGSRLRHGSYRLSGEGRTRATGPGEAL